jgi:hypothetical protein
MYVPPEDDHVGAETYCGEWNRNNKKHSVAIDGTFIEIVVLH